MAYFFIALILVLIILIVLFINVEVIIKLKKEKKIIYIIVLGVIKIPLTEKTKRMENAAEIVLKYKLSPGIVLKIMRDVLPVFKTMLSRFSLSINVKLKYGLYSPDKTAISYGILNGIVYTIDGMLKPMLKSYEGSYEIEPELNRAMLFYDVFISLKFRPVSMLKPGFRLLKIFLAYRPKLKKGGALDVGTSNRKINEDYNG